MNVTLPLAFWHLRVVALLLVIENDVPEPLKRAIADALAKVTGLAGNRFGARFVSAVGFGSVGLATAAAYARLVPFFTGDHAAVVETIAPWFSAGGFSADLSMRLEIVA